MNTCESVEEPELLGEPPCVELEDGVGVPCPLDNDEGVAPADCVDVALTVPDTVGDTVVVWLALPERFPVVAWL